MARGLHQVLAGAAPRDAITNHALLARDLFRARGWRSEIFCDERHLSGDLADTIFTHGEWSARAEPGDAAILHYSIDSPAFAHVQQHSDVTAVHYHNITPPELLWRDAPALAAQCAEGRRALPPVLDRTRLAAADSDFNAAEIKALGLADVTTVGVLRSTPPASAAVADVTMDGDGSLRLAFVGRLAPNKCQHDLILALGALREGGVDAQLTLVGSAGGNRGYLERCRRLAARAGVTDYLTLRGSVDDEELHGIYEESDVFVCLSEHEGYCVPLLEAMDHGIPIVAYAAGAVPETLGSGGLLIDDKSPGLVAEAIREAAMNEGLRDDMACGRQAQLDLHSPETVGRRVVEFAGRLAPC